MSKRLALFILLSALTLVYPLIFSYSIQAYAQECAAASARFPKELGYIDFPPFVSSLSGFPIMLLGAVIGASWFILFLWRK